MKIENRDKPLAYLYIGILFISIVIIMFSAELPEAPLPHTGSKHLTVGAVNEPGRYLPALKDYNYQLDTDLGITSDYLQNLFLHTNSRDQSIVVSFNYYIDNQLQEKVFDPIVREDASSLILNLVCNHIGDELRIKLRDGKDDQYVILQLPEALNFQNFPLTFEERTFGNYLWFNSDYKGMNFGKMPGKIDDYTGIFKAHDGITILHLWNKVEDIEYSLDVIVTTEFKYNY